MATIQTFKGVVRLTKAQLNTLINTGSLSDGTTTITYDPQNTIYLTPQEQASTSDAGVILIATDQDIQTGTNITKAVTPAQLKAAIIGIGTVFNLKGTKATASELPTSGNTIGDVWYVSDESVGYIWLNDGSEDKWEQLGLPIDLSGYVQYTDIVNNLTSTAIDKPLSANQGKVINDKISSLQQTKQFYSSMFMDGGFAIEGASVPYNFTPEFRYASCKPISVGIAYDSTNSCIKIAKTGKFRVSAIVKTTGSFQCWMEIDSTYDNYDTLPNDTEGNATFSGGIAVIDRIVSITDGGGGGTLEPEAKIKLIINTATTITMASITIQEI